MRDNEIIDKIFADALAHMSPDGENAPQEQEKELPVNAENGILDNDLPPADDGNANGNNDDEDLDTLLENLTSNQTEPATADNGDLDQVLDEMFPSDAVETDDLANVPGADDANPLDSLMESAMDIEDMPASAPADTTPPPPENSLDRSELDAAADIAADLNADGAADANPGLDDAALDELAEDLDGSGLALDAATPADADQWPDEAAMVSGNAMPGETADADLAAATEEDKERLLAHLGKRFAILARQKLQNLPAAQVRLIKSVNLKVDIELKFGEFSASGNDDSDFRLDN